MSAETMEQRLAEKLGFRIRMQTTEHGPMWFRHDNYVNLAAPSEIALWAECLRLMAQNEAAEQSRERMREALEKLPTIALEWSNNLANEWKASQQTITVYGDPAYQHHDKQIGISETAKKYAAECLASVWKIQEDEARKAPEGER